MVVCMFAGVPAMRRREVVVHQPTGALTGQVICLTTHAPALYACARPSL